ncbi:MAG: OmpH family outer membrane protein [Acidobacteria bacterium]|nr:MAG: OmpH family outer membrane protein [Acidobacteriota bacterium]
MKFRLFAAVLGLCLSVELLGAAAMAQAPNKNAAPPALPAAPSVTGPSKLAFINFQQAISDTHEGAKLVGQLKAKYEPKQAQFAQENAQIQALQKQLSDGASTMSADAKRQLSQKIQDQQRNLQQSAQDAQSDYQQDVEGVLQQVGTKLMPIIDSYARQHGYTLVVDSGLRWPQSPVVYAEQGTDITGVVVRLYDQEHPATGSGH